MLLYQIWFIEGEEYWEIDLPTLDSVHSTVIKKFSCKDESVIEKHHQVVSFKEASHVGKPLGIRESTTTQLIGTDVLLEVLS